MYSANSLGVALKNSDHQDPLNFSVFRDPNLNLPTAILKKKAAIRMVKPGEQAESVSWLLFFLRELWLLLLVAEIPINHSLDVFEPPVNSVLNMDELPTSTGEHRSSSINRISRTARRSRLNDFLRFFLKDLDGLVRIKVWMFQDEFWRLLR